MRRLVRGALLGAAMGLLACADAGSGRGLDSGPDGAGGKGDDVDDAKEDLSHSDRVEICNLEAEAINRDSPTLSDLIEAQQQRRDCIASVNDDVVPVIDERLADAGHPGAGYTADVLEDNRAIAGAICEQLVDARDEREHPDADFVQAECEASAELVIANLIGVHVDLGTEPLAMPGAYRRYLACYDVMPEEGGDIDSFGALTSCIHEADVDLSETMGRRISDRTGDDAQRRADAIVNGFDTHRARLDVLCEHFAIAGPTADSHRLEITELKCSITGLEGLGRLIGALTGLAPEGAAPRPDPEPVPQPEPEGPDPDPDPLPLPSGDHEELIVSLGGDPVDPFDYPAGLDGFRDYIEDVGVVHISADEIATPHNPQAAADCGYTYLIPDRDQWVKIGALAMLANELRELVGEPIYVRNWWRPSCYNDAVGGAAGGDHPDADAVDLDFQSASSRAKAQRFLCEDYWAADPSFNMSVGLGGVSIHLGVFSENGRRFWKYSSYTQQSGSGSCW